MANLRPRGLGRARRRAQQEQEQRQEREAAAVNWSESHLMGRRPNSAPDVFPMHSYFSTTRMDIKNRVRVRGINNMCRVRGINNSLGTLLLRLLFCLLIHSSRMQISAGRTLSTVSPSAPSLFTVAVHKEGEAPRRILLEGKAPPGANAIPREGEDPPGANAIPRKGEDPPGANVIPRAVLKEGESPRRILLEGEDPLGGNIIPRGPEEGESPRRIFPKGEDLPGANTIPRGEHSRLLELQDSVLDAQVPEVHLPLLDDLEVVVVWNHDKESVTIKKLREHVEDAQGLMKAGDKVILSGSLKGYEKGETMVTFVISPDSFFGSIESLPGEALLGVSYEYLEPAFSDEDLLDEHDVGGSSPLAVPPTPLAVPVVPLVGQDDANLLERVGTDPYEVAEGVQDGRGSSPLAVPATPLAVPVVPLVGQDDANLLERVGTDPYEVAGGVQDGGGSGTLLAVPVVLLVGQDDANLLERVGTDPYKEAEGVQDGGGFNPLAVSVIPLVGQDAAKPLQTEPASSGGRRTLQKNKKDKKKTEVDLLVLYTPAATEAMGGNEAAMNKIANMIAITNEIYANSYISISIRLVGIEEVEYKETPSDSTRSLYDLLEGKVPGSARMRTEYRADLVQMVTINSAFCGVALRPLYGADLVQMVTIDSSFCGVAPRTVVGAWMVELGLSVISTRCMRTTSAHEIGHNFGCNHDYYSKDNVENYMYNGFARCNIPQAARFQTVLSYGCQNGNQAQHLYYISNPRVLVNRGGSMYSTGDSLTANWAAAFTAGMSTVARYLPSRGAGGAGGGAGAGPVACGDGDGDGGCNVQTETCVGGGNCTFPNVCAYFQGKSACCTEDYPVWCATSLCFKANHSCRMPELCPSGEGGCLAPGVCASFEGRDACCPPEMPKWCGEKKCYASDFQCPTASPPPPSSPAPSAECLTSMGWAVCEEATVCAFYGYDVSCCPSSHPTWCGGDYCLEAGWECGEPSPSESYEICPSGKRSCAAPSLCAIFGSQEDPVASSSFKWHHDGVISG
eukprot:gene544-1956_t